MNRKIQYIKFTEEIMILCSSDDETSSVTSTESTSTVTEDSSVIVISSDEQSDTEDNSRKEAELEPEANDARKASSNSQQSGSSLLKSILTPAELKLMDPLPKTDESDKDEAMRRINALSGEKAN